MKKILIKLFCIGAVITLLNVSFVAAKDQSPAMEVKAGVVSPFFTNINVILGELEISSNGLASVSSFVEARNVDQVRLTVNLQSYQNGNWTTIKSWTVTNSNSYAYVDESWYVSKGYQYRTVSYGYVYRNGQLLESASIVSQEKWF